MGDSVGCSEWTGYWCRKRVRALVHEAGTRWKGFKKRTKKRVPLRSRGTLCRSPNRPQHRNRKHPNKRPRGTSAVLQHDWERRRVLFGKTYSGLHAEFESPAVVFSGDDNNQCAELRGLAWPSVPVFCIFFFAQRRVVCVCVRARGVYVCVQVCTRVRRVRYCALIFSCCTLLRIHHAWTRMRNVHTQGQQLRFA